nr:hypothetical protein [uncultured archaeon]
MKQDLEPQGFLPIDKSESTYEGLKHLIRQVPQYELRQSESTYEGLKLAIAELVGEKVNSQRVPMRV